MAKKKESLEQKVKREWRENIVRKSGCDRALLKDNIEFAEDNIMINQKMINSAKDNPSEKHLIKIGKSNITNFKKLKKMLLKKKECCNLP